MKKLKNAESGTKLCPADSALGSEAIGSIGFFFQ